MSQGFLKFNNNNLILNLLKVPHEVFRVRNVARIYTIFEHCQMFFPMYVENHYVKDIWKGNRGIFAYLFVVLQSGCNHFSACKFGIMRSDLSLLFMKLSLGGKIGFTLHF